MTQIMVADTTPSFDVEILSGVEAAGARDAARHDGDGSSVHSVFDACVSVVRDLHSEESDRCCLHLELDVAGSGIQVWCRHKFLYSVLSPLQLLCLDQKTNIYLQYEPGDHVGILPENETAVVQRAATTLGLPVNTVLRLRVPEGNPHNLTLSMDGVAAIPALAAVDLHVYCHAQGNRVSLCYYRLISHLFLATRQSIGDENEPACIF